MFGDAVVVTGRAEVSTLAVDDLERDTTSSGSDNGNTGVESLGDFDLETFASGELEGDVGVVHKSVQDYRHLDQYDPRNDKEIRLTLVTGGDPHDNNVLGILLVLGGNQVENLIIDDASVRIVDGTVSTDQELVSFRFFGLSVIGKEFAVLGVGLEDMGNTLRGIETGNLDYVFATRPLELVHLLLDAHTPELAHVILGIPNAELLVQTIKPIGGGTEESQGLHGNTVRHKVAHGMTDEEIRVLDVVPEVFPDFLLRRALLVDEVAADLDVGAVDDGEVWAGFLDQRNQAWHLGIIWNEI